MTAASWITLSRLLVLPLVLVLIPGDAKANGWAAGLFGVACATDALDGWVARRWGQVTDLGKWLDPVVDKGLVLGVLIALVEQQRIPAWGVVLILIRELGITAWRAGRPQVPGADWGGKLKTLVQMAAVILLLAPLPQPWFRVGHGCFWLAVVLTWLSAWGYLQGSRPTGVGIDTEPD